MTATANPHFELQHQAMSSLRQIHRICYGLEMTQVIAAFLVLILGYLARNPSLPRIVHLYGALVYIFLAVFAHVVVYYVLHAMSKNVRSAFVSNPGGVHEWLVIATAKLKLALVPFFIAHALSLLAIVLTTSFWATERSLPHQLAAWTATAVGLATGLRIHFALKRNTEYLASFVTTGGFSDVPTRNL